MIGVPPRPFLLHLENRRFQNMTDVNRRGEGKDFSAGASCHRLAELPKDADFLTLLCACYHADSFLLLLPNTPN